MGKEFWPLELIDFEDKVRIELVWRVADKITLQSRLGKPCKHAVNVLGAVEKRIFCSSRPVACNIVRYTIPHTLKLYDDDDCVSFICLDCLAEDLKEKGIKPSCKDCVHSSHCGTACVYTKEQPITPVGCIDFRWRR